MHGSHGLLLPLSTEVPDPRTERYIHTEYSVRIPLGCAVPWKDRGGGPANEMLWKFRASRSSLA